MTTEQFNEFTEEVIPQQLFHVMPTDIDDKTGAKVEELILINLIAGNPECLGHKSLSWFLETYLTKSKPITEPQCMPNECDHDVKWRTFYEGSSWCNKCWCYVDLPKLQVKEESNWYKFLRYIGILPRLKL